MQILNKGKKIIEVICFGVIIAFVLTFITRLFRTGEREFLVPFAQEEDDIDVVIIGGSNVLCYYDTVQMWDEKGYTAYNYASNAARLGLFKYYIKDIQRTHTPKLYIIDIRALPLEDEELTTRNWSEQLELFEPVRIEGLSHFFLNRKKSPVDAGPYFFDLATYHGNYDSLARQDQWTYAIDKSDVKNLTNGIINLDVCFAVDEPIVNDDKVELSSLEEEELLDLLEYCRKSNIGVLFTVGPYITNDEEHGKLNTAKDLIEQYGFGFIDFNYRYDEMGLDFTKDFADVNHVNYMGREKFTADFLGFLDYYGLVDHRGDEKYLRWDEKSKSFDEQYKKKWKASIDKKVIDMQEAVSKEDCIKAENFLDEWLVCVDKPEFSILVIENGGMRQPRKDKACEMLMKNLNLKFDEEDLSAAGFIGGDYSTAVPLDEDDSCYFGPARHIMIAEIDQEDEEIVISTARNTYNYELKKGMTIFVLNNQFSRIVDSVTLFENNDGKIELIHDKDVE